MKRFAVPFIVMVLCCCLFCVLLVACDQPQNVQSSNSQPQNEHKCVFNQEVVLDKYKASDSTCTEKAKYYYSCTCGEKGTQTFEYGGYTHNDNGAGVCLACGNIIKSTDGVHIELSADGTYAAVVSYNGVETNVQIAYQYEGLPVKKIGENAFFNSAIKSIIMPSGITEIDDSAFASCWFLEDVVLPETVTTLGNKAFNACNSLTSIVLPNSVTTIGEYAFSVCEKLNSLTIGEGVKRIKLGSFAGCKKLKDIKYNAIDCSDISYSMFGDAGIDTAGITIIIGSAVEKIPNSLFYHDPSNGTVPKIINVLFEQDSKCKSIGNCAFKNCIYLESIIIPDSVTSLGDSSFSLCSELKTITIGKCLSSIPANAFERCTSLVSIVVNYANTTYCSIDGNLYNKDGSIIICYAKGKGSSSFVIPSSVTEIGEYAFESCKNIRNIDIPSSVLRIKDDAFAYCTSLERIQIPDSVSFIGRFAFYQCSSARYLTIGKAVKNIFNNAFDECVALTQINYNATECNDLHDENCTFTNAGYNENGIIVVIGSSVKSIPKYLFFQKNGMGRKPKIVAVEFEDNSICSTIREQAFSGCDKLTNIVIPSSVISIEKYSFAYCSELTTVVVENSGAIIDEDAFFACSKLE